MIYTDELGRKCKATDAELQAYDEANGCERVPAKALDSLVALSGALLLIERNNELLEKTARKFGAWTLLRTAQGMLDKALNMMLKRISARQNLSVRENSKALTVAVSVKPMPMRWNMTVRDLDVLVGYALRHCSRECLMTEAESRECPLRGVLDCVPGVDASADTFGMCPYFGRGGEET
nr:MAG TPA: hypothetical protein [Caudoviricetes sp.]